MKLPPLLTCNYRRDTFGMPVKSACCAGCNSSPETGPSPVAHSVTISPGFGALLGETTVLVAGSVATASHEPVVCSFTPIGAWGERRLEPARALRAAGRFAGTEGSCDMRHGCKWPEAQNLS